MNTSSAASVTPAEPESPTDDRRPDLVGLSREELAEVLKGVGEKPFRAKLVWHWIYHRGARTFAEMTTLSKSLRERLDRDFRIGRLHVSQPCSNDSSRKWLLGFGDGNEAETVFIPEKDRGALCVSSQVGCTLACKFCRTGTQTLVRNLTAREIVGQVLIAKDAVGEWPSPPDGRLLSNIVMMGMGEPLFNFEEVAKAVKIIMDGEGIAISKRRVTLSTAGRADDRTLGERRQPAVSFTRLSTTCATRSFPQQEIPHRGASGACRNYPVPPCAPHHPNTMLKDVNDIPGTPRR